MYHPYKRPQASGYGRNKTGRAAKAAPKNGNQPQFDQQDKASGPALSRSSGSLRGAFFQNNDGKIELFDGQTGFTHMCSPSSQHSGHEDPLVIAIDGACPGNGTVRATKSGYGVFFAPGNPKNTAARIPNHLLEGAKHTNNIAEIMSAISALHGATIVARGGIQRYTDTVKHGDVRKPSGEPQKLRHVVVKSDSEYVVKSIAGGKKGEPPYIAKWETNGFRTAGGGAVKNAALWRLLTQYIDKLREMGVTVQFWHVRRELNKDADRLANEGLVLEASAVSSTVEEEIKRVWKAQGVSRKGRSHSNENEVIVLDDD
ncbi:hypothetical protein COL922a_003732 [Colletotrichum nupharicola]|nr:hypothetical protein COL922a_003732 [Colletotrichum nupharicola]